MDHTTHCLQETEDQPTLDNQSEGDSQPHDPQVAAERTASPVSFTPVCMIILGTHFRVTLVYQ